MSTEPTAADYAALKYLYERCQELRYAMRDVSEAPATKRGKAEQVARRRWGVVKALLEQLALDEQHPGSVFEVTADVRGQYDSAVLAPETLNAREVK
jgi:hypothetical protein